MTKETKVGLLVGLTFIILFAIILSEKGAKTVAPNGLTIADAGPVNSEVEIPAARQPLAGDGAFPVEPALKSIRPNYQTRSSGPIMLEEEEPIGQPIPGIHDDVPPLPDTVVQRLNMATLPETEVDLSRENDFGPQPGEDTISLEEAVAIATRRTPEASLVLPIEPDPEEDLTKTDNTTPIDLQPKTPPVEMRPKIIATHEVKAGESISKIASKYFGRSTPARINAIFDVNRDVLESVNSVRAGDILKIPGLNAQDTVAFVPVTDVPAVKVAMKQPIRIDDRTPRVPLPKTEPRPEDKRLADRTSSDSRDFVWYQVKDRDTLSGISQRELGSTRHYLKIYKINKDILPDKNTLKPGIKIRLPILESEPTSASNSAPRSAIPATNSVTFSRELAD